MITEILNIDYNYFMQLSIGNKNYNNNEQNDLKIGKIDNVGVINIDGAISYSHSFLHNVIGGSSFEKISEGIDNLMNDTDIQTIILRLQTPGGSAVGSSELSKKIFEASKIKRIVSFADPYAFSAGYQIGSAANEFYTIPSGQIGSIGTYAMHVDQSKMLENEGIKVNFIYAGEKKVDGNPFQELSESAKNDIQDEVNYLYNLFIEDVARNNATTIDNVKKNYGQGARVIANKGLSVGMISGIYNSYADFLRTEIIRSSKNILIEKQNIYKNNRSFLELEKLKNEPS